MRLFWLAVLMLVPWVLIALAVVGFLDVTGLR
jgi:hypothetical protein